MNEQDTFIDVNQSLQKHLDARKSESVLRYLQTNPGLTDFCSNDYLSFSRSEKIKDRVREKSDKHEWLNGSTGSRSISGNTEFAEKLECRIAAFHHAEAALIFNSGYDANIGLFSSIARKGDTLITDELIHASIIDGCRLSHANRYKFAHNDTNDLAKKIRQAGGNVFVAVESVYSMDGDMAPLKEIAAICEEYNANLIVDEAHATGVFGGHGRGLVNQEGIEKKVFARVHTFGKALGCHGAAVVGSDTLRNYLINFARSFIFTTALPMHSLLCIEAAYEELSGESFNSSELHDKISYFREHFIFSPECTLIDSISPVQSVVIPGSARARSVANELQQNGFDVRAILHPSVPSGKERLRISLHMHNTKEEILALVNCLEAAVNSLK